MSETLAGALERGRARLAAAGIEAAALEARVLLEHAAALDRAQLLSRGREPVAPGAAARYDSLIGARVRRVPLAYITGEREFWSMRLRVDERVLVPRPETETLVEAALERLLPGASVADVGTGSGAVVIALAREIGAGDFRATDCSAPALELARQNAALHGVEKRIEFFLGDLLAPLAGCSGALDMIVSNPPYIPTDDLAGLQPEVRDHEPRGALDGGPDGLACIARIVAGAPALLRRGGWLFLEVGAGQSGAACVLLARAGVYDEITTRRDLAGVERVVAARRAA